MSDVALVTGAALAKVGAIGERLARDGYRVLALGPNGASWRKISKAGANGGWISPPPFWIASIERALRRRAPHPRWRLHSGRSDRATSSAGMASMKWPSPAQWRVCRGQSPSKPSRAASAQISSPSSFPTLRRTPIPQWRVWRRSCYRRGRRRQRRADRANGGRSLQIREGRDRCPPGDAGPS